MTFEEHIEKVFEIIHKSESLSTAIESINTHCNDTAVRTVSGNRALLDVSNDTKVFIYRSAIEGADNKKLDLSEYLNDSYFIDKKLKTLL